MDNKTKNKTPVKKTTVKKKVINKEEVKPVVAVKVKPTEVKPTELKPSKFTSGQVFGTSRLKVHDRPSGGATVIKKLLLKGDVVIIDLNESTDNYYKVSHGVKPHVVEGFSLKKYIQV